MGATRRSGSPCSRMRALDVWLCDTHGSPEHTLPFVHQVTTCRPSAWSLPHCVNTSYLLFFQSRKDRTIGTRQILGGRGIYLGFSISGSPPNSPRNFQAGHSSPSALQRLTLNEFMSIQPRLGICIKHQSLPENPTILLASVVKKPQHKKNEHRKRFSFHYRNRYHQVKKFP
jgi:hypothetical protein